jgi:WD40 repeat protein
MQQPNSSNSAPSTDFCPYKGLQPYTEADRAYFFGRERDQEVIASNLYAAPLTVLYGASGVGKSSVLLAGVVPQLKEMPRLAVVVFRQWQDAGFAAILKGEIVRAVEEKTRKEVKVETTLALDEFLLECSKILRGPIFLIFDQFEEFFLYHPPSASADCFDAEFARAVNSENLRANFLLSMRDDGLSKLDRFRGRIPRLMGNTLRLEHLDREAGREAILKPLESYNRMLKEGQPRVSVEDELVLTLLEEVKTGKVTLTQTGQGQIGAQLEDKQDVDGRIETPFLQMVLTRLWGEEMAANSHTLRLETLRHLGGAERIVRTHLDKVMEKLSPEERDVAARLFRYLVTPSGMKIAHTPADLASYVELPPDEVSRVLLLLVSPEVRILRSIAPPPEEPDLLRYEIFHDVLAASILDWRRRYEEGERQEATRREQQERLKQEQEEAARQREVARRLRLRVAVLSLLLLVAVASSAVALYLWRDVKRTQRAVEQAKVDGESREISAYSLAKLADDPELSLLLAIEAGRLSPTGDAKNALRQALAQSRVVATMSGHMEDVNDVAFNRDATLLITGGRDNLIKVWKTDGTLQADVKGHTDAIYGITFSPDGQRIASTSLDNTVRLWSKKAGTRSWQEEYAWRFDKEGQEFNEAYVVFSRDSKHMVLTSNSVAAILDVETRQVNDELGVKMDETNVQQGAFSPDGEYIVLIDDKGYANIADWDPEPQKNVTRVLRTSTPSSYNVKKVAFSDDGKFVYTVDSNYLLQTWEWKTGSKLNFERRLGGDERRVRKVELCAFTPDAKYVATASLYDNYVEVWEVATGELVTRLSGHTDKIMDMEISADGKLAATASADETARVWSIERSHSTLPNDVTDLLALAEQKKNPQRQLTAEERKLYLHGGQEK